MFREPCAHRQEVKIVLYSSGIITPVGCSPVQVTPPTGVMIPDVA